MVNKEIKYEGKYLKFINDNSWEYVERKNCSGVAGILAVNDIDEVILVEQFRKSINKNLIEFPAGLVGDSGENEAIETAALRELEEEAGYSATKATIVAEGPTSSGLTSETITLVYAEGLKKVSAGGGIESENITVHEIPLKQIDSWLKQKESEGCLIDLKVYAGLYLLNSLRK